MRQITQEEYARQIELGTRWRVRCYVAVELLKYLNKINPFWTEEDLKQEMEIHVNRILKSIKERKFSFRKEEAIWRAK